MDDINTAEASLSSLLHSANVPLCQYFPELGGRFVERFRFETLFQRFSMTIFQKIINRQIPADIVYEDDLSLAFRDIHPQAPTHVLIIPKQPIPSLADATKEDTALLGHLLAVASQVAGQLGLTNGYRTVINCGTDGGQTVDHLHVHLLGGRPLTWPPG